MGLHFMTHPQINPCWQPRMSSTRGGGDFRKYQRAGLVSGLNSRALLRRPDHYRKVTCWVSTSFALYLSWGVMVDKLYVFLSTERSPMSRERVAIGQWVFRSSHFGIGFPLCPRLAHLHARFSALVIPRFSTGAWRCHAFRWRIRAHV